MHLGPKAKTDYVVLDAKLLLINMNRVDFFFFFFFLRMFIDTKI